MKVILSNKKIYWKLINALLSKKLLFKKNVFVPNKFSLILINFFYGCMTRLEFLSLAKLLVPEGLELVGRHALVPRGEGLVGATITVGLFLGLGQEIAGHVVIDLRSIVLIVLDCLATPTIILFLRLAVYICVQYEKGKNAADSFLQTGKFSSLTQPN